MNALVAVLVSATAGPSPGVAVKPSTRMTYIAKAPRRGHENAVEIGVEDVVDLRPSSSLSVVARQREPSRM